VSTYPIEPSRTEVCLARDLADLTVDRECFWRDASVADAPWRLIFLRVSGADDEPWRLVKGVTLGNASGESESITFRFHSDVSERLLDLEDPVEVGFG